MPTRVVTCHSISRAISSLVAAMFVWPSALDEGNWRFTQLCSGVSLVVVDLCPSKMATLRALEMSVKHWHVDTASRVWMPGSSDWRFVCSSERVRTAERDWCSLQWGLTPQPVDAAHRIVFCVRLRTDVYELRVAMSECPTACPQTELPTCWITNMENDCSSSSQQKPVAKPTHLTP